MDSDTINLSIWAKSEIDIFELSAEKVRYVHRFNYIAHQRRIFFLSPSRPSPDIHQSILIILSPMIQKHQLSHLSSMDSKDRKRKPTVEFGLLDESFGNLGNAVRRKDTSSSLNTVEIKPIQDVQLETLPLNDVHVAISAQDHIEDHNIVYRFPVSAALLNLLRDPEVDLNNHSFSDTCVSNLKALLETYNVAYGSKLLHIAAHPEITASHIVVYVHLAFAYSSNTNNLFTLFDKTSERTFKAPSKIVNSTNIVNPWSLVDCAVVRAPKTDSNDSKGYLELVCQSFEIVLFQGQGSSYFDKDTGKLYIEYDLLLECMESYGRLDLHFNCFLLQLLPTNQSPLLLAYTKNPANYVQGYSQKLIEIRNSRSMLKNDLTPEWMEQQIADIVDGKARLAELRDKVISGICTPEVQTLLIGMLGWGGDVTEEAVKLLNVFYDGTDWQMLHPFKPQVATSGARFTVDYLIENYHIVQQELTVLVKAPCLNPETSKIIVSWHKPKLMQYKSQDHVYIWVQMELGRFTRCGFYDWKLVRTHEAGKTASVNKVLNLQDFQTVNNLPEQQMRIRNARPVQGRYIVQPAVSYDLQIHEIVVDMQGQMNNEGNGNFKKVEKELDTYKDFGINCLYLMGVLERDNGPIYKNETQIVSYKRPNASPLAVVDRKKVNTMLGGDKDFHSLVSAAKQKGMKIIVDCLARVSSSRMHRRYRDLINYGLDENGKKRIIYGTDGRALNYEDSAILNYRKKEVWDLLIEEVLSFIDEYDIDGIHLDNGQAWPQIFKLDTEELYRKESGGRAYDNRDIFQGAVVLQDENCGYWGSESRFTFPNPILVKLCQQLWKKRPQFIIIAESWSGLGGIEQRCVNIINSGPIPRMFKLPIGISYVFGQHLHKDGSIKKVEQKNVSSLKKWYEQTQKILPKGSIVIQSTTSHNWPYPAFLYKRATWAMVDLFFFLPDLPMTFIGEQEGEVYRSKTSLTFTAMTKKQGGSLRRSQGDSEADSLRRIDSTFFESQFQDYDTSLLKSVVSSSIRESADIPHLRESFIREVGPEYGYNLKQIYKHYRHRRHLRAEHKILRKGKLISVEAEHQYGFHTRVLAFARWTSKQLALVAINLNEGPIDMNFNLRSLKYLFPNSENSNIVVEIRDLLNPTDESTNFYVIHQFITSKIEAHLEAYKSLLWEVIIHKGGDKLAKAYECSSNRLKKRISETPPRWIYSSNVTNGLIKLVETSVNLADFTNSLVYLWETAIEPVDLDFNTLISKTYQFWTSRTKTYKLFAYFKKISANYSKAIPQKLALAIDRVINQNKLGPIAFITPELGKWSTVGGLGVMVDELSKQLAKIGEEVIVVSPYYEFNKKGQTGYLAADGFVYQTNIVAWSSNIKYEFGLHKGKLNGVTYLWLHNSDLFSFPYKGEDALYVTKQLVFFALATLEAFCQQKIFPSMIVTNDWMSGLVPAYVRNGRYPKVFDGTKFMHIVHNLDPLYEGRLYPKHAEGDLGWLTQINSDWIIDPNRDKVVINPSRCALTTCDNWGTVSHSYKYDLLRDSPLSSVLWRYPNPFSFPNGVRKIQRQTILKTKTPGNHLESKRKIQMKYFGNSDLDPSSPLFSFVGRVTKQKGVHLILDVVERLLHENNFKMQFLVGGPSDSREEYGKFCAERMIYLASKYPKNFWADPKAFFEDGPLINIGSDFGLMPSLFEPGGIVQHEFFSAGTPVVSFRTGGLKDTIFEYDYKTQKGNGFNFMNYTSDDFRNCIQRALNCYHNQKHYDQLRENAAESVIDVEDVAKAWNSQFHRMHNKIFVQWNMVDDEAKNITDMPLEKAEACHKMFDTVEGRVWDAKNEITKSFEKVLLHAQRLKAKPCEFNYATERLPKPKDISIAGSWDGWKKYQPLKYDSYGRIWKVTLMLQPGTYTYKFIIDESEWVCSPNDPIEIDMKNAENNVVIIGQ